MGKAINILLALLFVLLAHPAYSASSIDTTQPADGTSYSPATIRQNFQRAANDINALQSMNAGSSPPSNPSVGTLWLQQSSGAIWTLYVWSGRAWLATAAIDTTNNIWMPPIGGGVPPNIISAALMDIGTFPQASLNVTGSNQIQNLGNSTPPGGIKVLVFAAGATLINSPPALSLPGAANIAQTAGDVAIALHQGGGNWIVLFDTKVGPNSNLAPFVGDTGTGGKQGLVPAPPAGTAAAGDFLSANGRFTTTFLSPLTYGAKGDGVTNDSAAVSSCLLASQSTGQACHFPGGKTFAIDDVSIPSPLVITGDGPSVSKIIRRAGSNTTGGVLHCYTSNPTACTHVWISNITIDGNKTNESFLSAANLNIGQYADVHIRNVNSINVKVGVGIGLDKSADQAQGTSSDLINDFVSTNDGDGISVTTASWRLLVQNVISTSNGGNGFNMYYTPGITPLADQFQFTTVEGGEFSSNGAAGFVARGFIQGYAAGGFPIYGPGIEPVSNIKVHGVLVRNNFLYGLVVQAYNAVVSDGIGYNNNTSNSFGGDFLGPCEFCQWNNMRSEGPGFVGLDVGTSLGAHVNGGQFTGSQYGVNIGASQFSDVKNAVVSNNSLVQISAISGEASGDGHGIPGFTEALVLSNNRIGCPASGVYGIHQYGGGFDVAIYDNYVEGCDSSLAISADFQNGRIDNNKVGAGIPPVSQFDGAVDIDLPASTTTLIIPPWADTIGLHGVNNFSTVQTFEQAAIGTGVYSVVINAGGLGYTQGTTTAVFSGCTVQPTGTVAVSYGGFITGWRMATPGSGCTSPTVSFAGGGSGAVGTAYTTPLGNGFQKELLFLLGGLPSSPTPSLTIGGGGNVILASPLAGLGPTSLVKFHVGSVMSPPGMGMTLYEESRVTH